MAAAAAADWTSPKQARRAPATLASEMRTSRRALRRCWRRSTIVLAAGDTAGVRPASGDCALIWLAVRLPQAPTRARPALGLCRGACTAPCLAFGAHQRTPRARYNSMGSAPSHECPSHAEGRWRQRHAERQRRQSRGSSLYSWNPVAVAMPKRSPMANALLPLVASSG